MSRYLGIDYGQKRVGLAMSDPTLIIAQPLKTLAFQSLKQLTGEILKVVEQYDVSRIIVGLPLTLKGTDSDKTREVRRFAEELSGKTEIPVIFYDERLSTIQAHNLMKQYGKKPSKQRDKIDQIAAQYILQAYLDQEKNRVKHD